MVVNDFQVSADWLNKHGSDDDVIVLDATMAQSVNVTNENAGLVIKGALRFDFSNHIVDKAANSPNMMPSANDFESAVRELGIGQHSQVIVYDAQGLFSAARAWYMFRAMGHEKVAILRGGLPVWLEAGFPVTDEHVKASHKGDFRAAQQRGFFVDKQYVLNNLTNVQSQVVDARSFARFSGQDKEPRAGMRSGHIPNSLNLHYSMLVENHCLLDKDKLVQIFAELAPQPEHFVFTCGSGVTACILALAAEIAGIKRYSVYDGSWSEWGKDKLLPIDTV